MTVNTKTSLRTQTGTLLRTQTGTSLRENIMLKLNFIITINRIGKHKKK